MANLNGHADESLCKETMQTKKELPPESLYSLVDREAALARLAASADAATELRRVIFGTDEAIAETVELQAGALKMVLQKGKLWNLTLDEVEIWHGLGFVFRDTDWGTPEPVIEHVESVVAKQRFRVNCRGYFPTYPIRLPFRINIEGSEDGYIRFIAETTPESDLQTNRLGLCLLHPMSARGARVGIEHIDGRESLSTFPIQVPAWPPFMLIRAIRHEYAPGYWARCEFDGDLFELEDQRNNSDASFKTYSRSNLMPRPYTLRRGLPVRQCAELWVERSNPTPVPEQGRHYPPVSLRVDEKSYVAPKLGTEIMADDIAKSHGVVVSLLALRLSHVHLAIDGNVTLVEWDELAEQLQASNTRLRLDLSLPEFPQADGVLDALQSALKAAAIVPEGVAVFPSEKIWLDAARRRFPQTAMGGGTPHFFVQLHRSERLGEMDFLTFTTSPIVHGTRDEEVMLTLQSLPSLVETLRAKYSMPLRIGPSTIGARASPLGRQPLPDATRRLALNREDPRCKGVFGAAWAVGYFAQFARARVDAITLMSLTGHSRILDAEPDGKLLRYPSYFALERLCGHDLMYDVTVSEPKRLAALAFPRKRGKELLVANLTPESVEFELDGAAVLESFAVLDADTWKTFSAMTDPWQESRHASTALRQAIKPYGVMSLFTVE